jgi:hypothetical protein
LRTIYWRIYGSQYWVDLLWNPRIQLFSRMRDDGDVMPEIRLA